MFLGIAAVNETAPDEAINRLGNRGDRVSVLGSKSYVFLATCGQIWQIFLGTYDLRSS